MDFQWYLVWKPLVPMVFQWFCSLATIGHDGFSVVFNGSLPLVRRWNGNDPSLRSNHDHEDNPAGQHHHEHEEGWYPDAQHLTRLTTIFFIVWMWECEMVANINNILRVSMRTIQQVDTIKIRRNMKLVNLEHHRDQWSWRRLFSWYMETVLALVIGLIRLHLDDW